MAYLIISSSGEDNIHFLILLFEWRCNHTSRESDTRVGGICTRCMNSTLWHDSWPDDIGRKPLLCSCVFHPSNLIGALSFWNTSSILCLGHFNFFESFMKGLPGQIQHLRAYKNCEYRPEKVANWLRKPWAEFWVIILSAPHKFSKCGVMLNILTKVT